MVAAVLVLGFTTPALINKKPIKQPPPDYHPLTVWLLLNLLFATGGAVNGLWPAAGMVSVASVAVTLLALRGSLARQ